MTTSTASARAWESQRTGVYRGAANNHEITLWHDFEDLAAAETFANSPHLLETMKDAGVKRQPDIWVADEA